MITIPESIRDPETSVTWGIDANNAGRVTLYVGSSVVSTSAGLPVTDVVYEDRRSYNSDNQVEYIGEALPGSEDSSSVWRIHKRTYVSRRLTKISWSDYNANFDKIWNDRTSYDYR